MDKYNNKDIHKAIKDVFKENPELKYDEEKHFSLYIDVLNASINQKSDNDYGFARSVVYNSLKSEIAEIIKLHRCRKGK